MAVSIAYVGNKFNQFSNGGFNSQNQTASKYDTITWLCENIGNGSGVTEVFYNAGTVLDPHIFTSGSSTAEPQAGDIISRDAAGSELFEGSGFIYIDTSRVDLNGDPYTINNLLYYIWVYVGENGVVTSTEILQACPASSPLTLTTEIGNQEATNAITYCYLYEPLRVEISGMVSAKKLYVELELLDTASSNSVVGNLVDYAVYDLNSNEDSYLFDLMKLAQQHHDSNIYNFSKISEMSDYTGDGWKSVVSEYIYRFKITTDTQPIPIVVKKLPIIGQRGFNQFEPYVSSDQCLATNSNTSIGTNGYFGAITHLESEGERWKGREYLRNNLAPLSRNDLRPSVTSSTSTIGKHNCADMVVWKSRFGGWQVWAFDMSKKSIFTSYTGKMQVGLFEATAMGGSAYVPVDYLGIESGYSITLKSLALTSDELRIVADIESSPAIYLISEDLDGENLDILGNLELMRLSAATVPLNSQASGGNFSITLKSISKSYQHTR
tara:strand:+ start:2119 stop:3603 length:1485 start_codon:yes stop_codon:yes gene_type:complete